MYKVVCDLRWSLWEFDQWQRGIYWPVDSDGGDVVALSELKICLCSALIEQNYFQEQLKFSGLGDRT